MAALVEKAPGHTLGRTAIMKLSYYLQVLQLVPLGYEFRLHTFGPFDSDVLDDLAYAEVFGAVKEKVITQSQGYRYEIKPGGSLPRFSKRAKAGLDSIGKQLIGRFKNSEISTRRNWSFFPPSFLLTAKTTRKERKSPWMNWQNKCKRLSRAFPCSMYFANAKERWKRAFFWRCANRSSNSVPDVPPTSLQELIGQGQESDRVPWPRLCVAMGTDAECSIMPTQGRGHGTQPYRLISDLIGLVPNFIALVENFAEIRTGGNGENRVILFSVFSVSSVAELVRVQISPNSHESGYGDRTR